MFQLCATVHLHIYPFTCGKKNTSARRDSRNPRVVTRRGGAGRAAEEEERVELSLILMLVLVIEELTL